MVSKATQSQKCLMKALLCFNRKQSISIYLVAVSFYLLVSSAESKSASLGIHPLDDKYFAAEVIKCKDGSKSFARDRLNDDFCDCIDGTDEPGTSACPAGKFYCRNVGSMPQFIFSSHVNDRVCDCCDGSDEYDGGIMCPNACVMGGNVVYKYEGHMSTLSHLPSTEGKQRKVGINLDDLIEMLTGLKMIIIAELAVIYFLVVQYKRLWSKKRRYQ